MSTPIAEIPEPRSIHPSQDTEALLKRLRRIEGQVRGVQKMVEEGRYCLDILTQLQALEAASRKVGQQILEGHMRGCIADAVRDDRADEAISELMRVLDKAMQQ